MNLCTDCKHCIIDTALITRNKQYICSAYVENIVDPVTGDLKKIGDLVSCAQVRFHYGEAEDCAEFQPLFKAMKGE